MMTYKIHAKLARSPRAFFFNKLTKSIRILVLYYDFMLSNLRKVLLRNIYCIKYIVTTELKILNTFVSIDIIIIINFLYFYLSWAIER